MDQLAVKTIQLPEVVQELLFELLRPKRTSGTVNFSRIDSFSLALCPICIEYGVVEDRDCCRCNCEKCHFTSCQHCADYYCECENNNFHECLNG